MDLLKFGETELRGSVTAVKTSLEGETVPGLELRIDGAVNEEGLKAMAENDLEIYDADGQLLGRQEGYTTVVRHTVVLAKLNGSQKDLAAARRSLARLEEEKTELERENAALLYENLTGEAL